MENPSEDLRSNTLPAPSAETTPYTYTAMAPPERRQQQQQSPSNMDFRMIMDAIANLSLKQDLAALEIANLKSGATQGHAAAASIPSDPGSPSPLMDLSEVLARPRQQEARRETILERVLNNSPHFGNRQQQQIVHSSVKFSGRLENVRSPWTLLAFCKEIEQFQSEYSQHAANLNIAAYVSDEVIAAIKVKFRNVNSADLKNVSKVSNERFMAMLYEIVKPDSPIKFSDTLGKTHFREKEVSATNFRPFYESYLLYERDFVEIYAMCSRNNDANIPLCTHREYGTIFVFLNNMKPKDLGWHLYNTQLVQNRYGSDDFNKFLVDFNSVMAAYYEQSESAKTLNQTIGYAFRSSNNAGKSTSSVGSRSSTSTPMTNRGFGKSTSTPADAKKLSFGSRTPITKVSHILSKGSESTTPQHTQHDAEQNEETQEEIDLKNDMLLALGTETSLAFHEGLRSEEDDVDDVYEEEDSVMNMYVPGNGNSSGQILAILPHNATPKTSTNGFTKKPSSGGAQESTLPCFQFMRERKCSNSNCRYSHDERIVEEAMERYRRDWYASKSSSKGSN